MTSHTDPAVAAPANSLTFSALIGLTTLTILLQGVWAGIFLSHDHRPEKWVNVHAHGADVAIVLSLLAVIAALVQLRSRKDLLIGTILLFVVLVVESVLGGRITEHGQDNLTAVHVPLAMIIMGLAVWLPVRARSGRSSQH